MKSDSGIEFSSLKADGGAAQNKFLMQFQSDISDIKIIKPDCSEATALGAAFLAGLAVGFWKDKSEIIEIFSGKTEYNPTISYTERKDLLNGWKLAVSRTFSDLKE